MHRQMHAQKKHEGSKIAVKHAPANKVQKCEKSKNYVQKLHHGAYYSINVQSEQ